MARRLTTAVWAALALAVLLAVPPRALGGARMGSPPVLLVRPPAGPWLLVNTTAAPPTVHWSGPGLVMVDSPEVLSGPLLRSVAGGAAAAHLMYADRSPDLPSTFRLFIYVRNALDRTEDVWLSLRAPAQAPMSVRYSPAAIAAHVPEAQALVAGEQVSAHVVSAESTRYGPPQTVARGHALRSVWTVPAGQVLCVWWPVKATTAPGQAISLSVWAGPGPHAPAGAPLPPGRTGVVRTTLPHGDGAVTLAAPVSGAWAYDLDNDAPTPSGASGGDLCPPAVCLNGEVTTAGGAPFTRSADPLPGEMEGGVDALDAPGHAPAAALWRDGALLRTGNYGDYGTRLTLRLTAPSGRDVFAAVVPGYDHAAPWAGITTEAGGPRSVWQLPMAPPPPGEGYEIAGGAPSAIVTTTMTPGAYAPWRLIVWSEPAG